MEMTIIERTFHKENQNGKNLDRENYDGGNHNRRIVYMESYNRKNAYVENCQKEINIKRYSSCISPESRELLITISDWGKSTSVEQLRR